MKAIIKKSILWIGLILFPTSLSAAPLNQVGVGLSVTSLPEDQAFDPYGVPVNLFYDHDFNADWAKFRFGIGQYEQILEYSFMGESYAHQHQAKYLILAYRFGMDFFSDFHFSAAAGAAWVQSNLKIHEKLPEESASSIGAMSDLTLLYRIGDFGVGVQALFLSSTAQFESISIPSGNNELTFITTYAF